MKARDDTAERPAPRDPVCLSGAGRVTAPAAAVAIFSDDVDYGTELPVEGQRARPLRPFSVGKCDDDFRVK